MLQTVMKQLQAPARNATATLPENIKFPLASQEDVDNLEDYIEDSATKETLVRDLTSF